MQEFQYKMLEDETFAVTGYSGEEKEVVIPDTHWGKSVTVLFDSLFSGHAEIESIQIPDTVTDIGEFFFAPGTKLSPMAFENKGRENGSAYSYKLYEK